MLGDGIRFGGARPRPAGEAVIPSDEDGSGFNRNVETTGSTNRLCSAGARLGPKALIEQSGAFDACGDAGELVAALRLMDCEMPNVTLLDFWPRGQPKIAAIVAEKLEGLSPSFRRYS
jgi:hypothetical protein